MDANPFEQELQIGDRVSIIGVNFGPLSVEPTQGTVEGFAQTAFGPAVLIRSDDDGKVYAHTFRDFKKIGAADA